MQHVAHAPHCHHTTAKQAVYEMPTAVQVVGYDNVKEAWLYKQSWGPRFAMGGFAWVSMDVSGVCPPDDTWGLTFTPERQAWPPVPLQPAPGRQGCFTYKAQPGDSPARLAAQLGLGTKGLAQLLLDNKNQISDSTKLTPGTSVTVCGIKPRLQPAPSPSPVGRRPTPAPTGAPAISTRTVMGADAQALWLAASPQAFDSRSAWHGLSVLGPVKAQGTCGTAVAFAVLAAAQTAAAVALNTSLPAASLSEHDFYFCTPRGTVIPRSCASGMAFWSALELFLRESRMPESIAAEECVPYQPDRGADACERKCQGTAAQLWRGTWQAVQLGTVADMQRHILAHGSIICRMPLYSDTRPFYMANQSGIYSGPGEWLDTCRGFALEYIRHCAHGELFTALCTRSCNACSLHAPLPVATHLAVRTT